MTWCFTIGLPLVAGFSLRNLAGVLAHEFGHFAQGTGMRLTYIIRAINAWFYRVVHERDALDESLSSTAEEAEGFIVVAIWIAIFFVWLTRQILKLLMLIGHAISCMMLRQMEYDADRYEARVAGSATFADTANRLQLLGLASQKTFGDLGEAWTERRLVDDLAGLIVTNEASIPTELRDKLLDYNNNQKTGALDTHPADADRIASVQRESGEGVFTLEIPAHELFNDFQQLSKKVTLDYYRCHVDEGIDDRNLVSSEDMMAIQQELNALQEAYRSYFGDILPDNRPLAVTPAEVEGLAEPDLETVEQLAETRTRIVDALPKIHALYTSCGSKEAAYRQLELSSNADNQALLQGVAEDLKHRLLAGINLLYHPDVSVGLEDVKARRDDVQNMFIMLVALGSLTSRVHEFETMWGKLAQRLAELEHGGDEHSQQQAFRQAVEVNEHMRSTYTALSAYEYPFPHPHGEISMAQYIAEEMPDEEDIGATLQVASGFAGQFYTLYYRVLGRLARHALAIEALLAMEPIVMAAPEDDEQES